MLALVSARSIQNLQSHGTNHAVEHSCWWYRVRPLFLGRDSPDLLYRPDQLLDSQSILDIDPFCCGQMALIVRDRLYFESALVMTGIQDKIGHVWIQGFRVSHQDSASLFISFR